MDINKRKQFGAWIRNIRKDKGMSLRLVSVKLGYMTRGTMASVESGYTPLPLEKFFDLADLYKMDIEDLLDKLAEFEPEVYRRFCDLEDRYYKHFLKKFRGQSRHSHKFSTAARNALNHRGEIAAHHLPFPGAWDEVDNLYIIRHDDIIESQIPLFDMEPYYDTPTGSERICHPGN